MAAPATPAPAGYTTATTGPAAVGWRSSWGAPEVENEDNPALRWPASIEVYDQMRRTDPQVMSVLRAVTLPIRRTTWRIDPAGAKPEVTRLVADDLGLPVLGEESAAVLRTRDRFSWAQHLYHCLLMLPFGHSFFEQEYRFVNGQQRLRRLGWRPSRSIEHIEVASDGGLEWIRQKPRPGGDPNTSREIPVKQLVAYVNDREGGNWLGQSLLRPAYSDWLLKTDAKRIRSMTLRRNGLGIPDYEVAEQPESVKGQERVDREKAELDAGAEMVKRLQAGNDAGVSRPAGSKLTLRGVEGTLPNADEAIRYHDEQIARAVLANFLNLGGDNSTGSYALGETFADFFTQSLQTVSLHVQDVTNQHVIEDLVDLNFGETEPAPRLVFDEIGSRHPATAEAMQRLLVSGGITGDDQLEQFLRTTYGLPAADPATARPRPTTTGSTTPTGDAP